MISQYFFKRPSKVPVTPSTPPPSDPAPAPVPAPTPVSAEDPKPISDVLSITDPDGSLVDLKDYLHQKLTTNQQRLFMVSTWMYLNQNGECCIELEDAMKWMGVTEKKHQKTKLEQNFVENLDYQVLLGTSAQNSTGRGRPKQTILLTPNTFKDLCMMAGTPEGKEARRYFRTMELIVKEYTLMQQAFKDQQLFETRAQLEEQARALQAKETELQHFKSKKHEQRENTGFCYVIKTNGGIKVGKTKDIGKRVKGLQTANVGELKILLAFPTSNPDLVERDVHYYLDRYRLNANREFFDCDPEYIKTVVELRGNFVNTMGSAYQAITRPEIMEKLARSSAPCFQ
ncbi:hypothetical protein HK102_003862 [Quaeritorhiza haematococci]|nr:hypothetical protein HK102_003862 [Quaeritorhiza haematococci]